MGVSLPLPALVECRGLTVEHIIDFATVASHDCAEAIGDQQVGANGPVAVGGDRQGPQTALEQDLFQRIDRLTRPSGVEQDVGQEQTRFQPLGLAAARPRPPARSWPMASSQRWSCRDRPASRIRSRNK